MLTWPPKDPEEVLDYDIDWSQRLDTGDTITGSTWEIADDDATLTIDSNSFSNTATKVWLSEGTLGSVYKLTNTITTDDGRTMEQTVKLKIRAK